MRINDQTKLAVLLKGHPEALETIVGLSPHFKKLRNSVLRTLMAGRTNIAEAAKIGGCTPADFFQVLSPLGFEADEHVTPIREEKVVKHLPQFLQQLDPALLVTLDVRAMLAGGTDPLQLIQQTVRQLKPGAVLRIVNTFEPTPLIRLLSKQGFEAHVDQLEEKLIETYFYKVSDAPVPTMSSANTDDWEAVLEQHGEGMLEIDVRHLEMPAPMMSILEALEKLPEGKALFVHHKRVPVYLLSELKDRGFEYRIKDESEGQVKLLVFRRGHRECRQEATR